ncbi:hypothetical protein ACOSQ2_004474 [Xanthoceras sorbifolium]
MLRYERLPEFCFQCGILGHATRECLELDHTVLGGSQQFDYGTWLRAQSPVRVRKESIGKQSSPSRSTDGVVTTRDSEEQRSHVAGLKHRAGKDKGGDGVATPRRTLPDNIITPTVNTVVQEHIADIIPSIRSTSPDVIVSNAICHLEPIDLLVSHVTKVGDVTLEKLHVPDAVQHSPPTVTNSSANFDKPVEQSVFPMHIDESVTSLFNESAHGPSLPSRLVHWKCIAREAKSGIAGPEYTAVKESVEEVVHQQYHPRRFQFEQCWIEDKECDAIVDRC